MISKESLHIDWIKKVSSANRKADKILVEKVIRALMLLEGLVKQNLNFVFKGGTALMLILDSSKRLLIDISERYSTSFKLYFLRIISYR